jgi:hypothetical protein
VQVPGDAKRTILVQAYSFTSAPIAKALLDAHTRGVQVQVILDTSQRNEKYSSADFLANQGVPTTIDANHAISHNKVMIIDGETVITGSFNFTKAAQEKNAENGRSFGIPPWPRNTRRTGRRMRRIVSRMWAEEYGGGGGAGDKREMMTIDRLHDHRPAHRLPPVGGFDEEISDTTREPRGMPEADASPLACD